MGRKLIPEAAEALQKVLQAREDADNRGDQAAVSDPANLPGPLSAFWNAPAEHGQRESRSPGPLLHGPVPGCLDVTP